MAAIDNDAISSGRAIAGHEVDADEPLRRALHDLKQPLNIIRLANGNLRHRIAPVLNDADAQYLDAKLNRVEEQVQRAADMIEALMNGNKPAE